MLSIGGHGPATPASTCHSSEDPSGVPQSHYLLLLFLPGLSLLGQGSRSAQGREERRDGL